MSVHTVYCFRMARLPFSHRLVYLYKFVRVFIIYYMCLYCYLHKHICTYISLGYKLLFICCNSYGYFNLCNFSFSISPYPPPPPILSISLPPPRIRSFISPFHLSLFCGQWYTICCSSFGDLSDCNRQFYGWSQYQALCKRTA